MGPKEGLVKPGAQGSGERTLTVNGEEMTWQCK